MFKIRTDHIAAFDVIARDRFLREMVAHLKTSFADELKRVGINGQAVETYVRDGISDASRRDLSTERNVRCFLEYLLLLSPADGPPSLPEWAESLLAQEDLDEDEKLDYLSEEMLFQQESPR